MRIPVADQTLAVAIEGYGRLPDRRRRTQDGVIRTRVLGRRTFGLSGPEAARFFYDEFYPFAPFLGGRAVVGGRPVRSSRTPA
jgi:hypothetical protein